MYRRAGMAFGAALACVAAAAACGQGETPDSTANGVPQAAEVSQTAQTTPATQPVVTVYKSPT